MSNVPATSVKPVPVLKPAQDVLHACQRGDAKALAEALGNDPVAVARLAIELRRENVATLGEYEAFVRHTDDGSLRQVIRPVPLSTKDGTLYQILVKRPVCTQEGHDCFGQAINTRNHQGRYEWREVNASGDPNKATVSYSGYQALNAVAGCAVGQPPSIVVDGVTRTNPYVERAVRKDGRPGNIQRIVIGVVVVGPAPATGNPVAVNYTLDYDPSKDLAHMLAKVAKDHPDQCYLANEDEATGKPGWAFLPISDGVGFWYDLRQEDVLEVYKDYVNLQGMALKKAQTVARRNAMRSHPALGGIAQNVVVDRDGRARVAAVGWAPADGTDVNRWRDLQERLARGLPLPAIETLDMTAAYTPEEEEPHDEDAVGTRPALAAVAEPAPQAAAPEDPELEERNRLIAYIDQGIQMLDPQQVADLNYSATAPLDDLRRVRADIDRLTG